MSQYPTAVDDASTLYVPVDRLGAATLSTTTTALTGSGDTTIAVASTAVGFPSANNLIVIGSELISYTGKTATTFTGCTRGVGNTVASAHAAGSVVIAPMSAEYILALQSAVIALQNTVGVEGAYLFQLAAEAVASAAHNHQDAAGGGTLDGAAIATGTVSRDRLQTMVGAVADPATDGVKGAVPAPTSAEVQYFLAGDGNWRSAIHRVTFVGPDLMTVTGSPATSYLSTIGLQWNAQVKNKVVASPASGADGIPTCRALVSDDIPNLAGEKIASGTVANARLVNAGALTVTVGDGMLGGGDVAIGGSVTVNAKVRSVFGRTGFVTQEAGDYTTAQIANTSVIAGSTLNEAIANLDYVKAATSVTSDLQSQINAISSNITSITNGLNAVGSDVQTLIAQVSALENGYAAIENSVDVLQGNVADIEAELTDIWNTLASKASVDHTH